MNESEEEKSGVENTDAAPEAAEAPIKDKHGRFLPGNRLRIGTDPNKDPAELGRKGDKKKKAGVKRLTTYLRQHLEELVRDNPDLADYHTKHGAKTVASLLMHRILEEATKHPAKAHPLVRDILNRVDGMMTPEIEVDPDTPVSVIKFVVVDKRAQVREENGDAAQS